ncbi:MAG: tRNA (guanosine(46)-N7)-methyltransferase TrmB [Peptococcaceae bacterium]
MSRIRRKAGTKEELLQLSPPLVLDPKQYKGKWQEYFQNANPIRLELGMGKGTFISTLALENPGINYIGLELREEVLLSGLKKSREPGLANIAFIWTDIKDLADYFAGDEVNRIYINFCDPWPKVRHAKRRLTHAGFLNVYQEILVNQAEVHFKTDNEELFEFSLNQFSQAGFVLKNIRLNLYRNLPDDNVPTEYELKYREQGLKIMRLEAVNNGGN